MRATVGTPADQSGVWLANIGRDDSVIDPVILAGSGDDEAFALNRAAARAAHRYGAQAHRPRAGRFRPRRHQADAQCRPRRHRQARLFRRRAASCLRRRRHPHAGVGDEAGLADLRRLRGARVGREPRLRRHRRAPGGGRQCSARRLQARRPADAGGRPVGGNGNQRHHAASRSMRCRRSATPISPCASPGSTPMSASAAAPWWSRPGAS